ncbi:hypothetical protein K437DRAFT_165729 [Tilletiaria anomala UBC 951]|uniref:Uncharacterized protein n=1 Tax=Tilletiaria anomala (strain ATCC 24038 / CBS 436.72 / UBC 951) TaxID=1037660 RepID=A0A066VLG6_TILAU|nr:uncharacterized protein K437DRAFT_165729 [Tilletiaria anomala UBC 951]KDN42311.1 hypothetical protein K437DRAFT_165729 [Tilletiaria anomala UBC 951]
MKFSSVLALAGVVGFTSVMAAPAPAPAAMVTAAPVLRRVPVMLAARDMDPNEAQQLVNGLTGSVYNGKGNCGNQNNSNGDDSGDNSGSGSDCEDGSGANMQDVHNYINDAASSLNNAASVLRESMSGQVPRPVSSYLKEQSSRISQASKIADGGVSAMTKSASQFVSIASAYSVAQASFTPQAHRIEQQIDNGTYNAASGGVKAPTVLTLGGALGAVLVWAAL